MLSTVVGNFPKVGDSHEQQKLRRTIESYQQGKASLQELEQIENDVTREAIEHQIASGIALITDGQIRWTDPLTWPARKLKGVSINGLLRFFDNNVYYRQPVVDSPVGWETPLLVDDFKFAHRVAAGRAEVKAVLPGPYSLGRLSKNNHYGRFEDLVFDFARALSKEMEALEEAGATFIQIDEPSLPLYPENFQMAAKALEICARAVKRARVALTTYFAGIGRIHPNVLSLPVHVLGLDLVSAPENVRLVREQPFTHELALGVVDARNTRMEREEDLLRLIQSLQKNGDRIRYVNPSCGLEFLPHDVAIRKLALVGTLAGKVKQAV